MSRLSFPSRVHFKGKLELWRNWKTTTFLFSETSFILSKPLQSYSMTNNLYNLLWVTRESWLSWPRCFDVQGRRQEAGEMFLRVILTWGPGPLARQAPCWSHNWLLMRISLASHLPGFFILRDGNTFIRGANREWDDRINKEAAPRQPTQCTVGWFFFILLSLY